MAVDLIDQIRRRRHVLKSVFGKKPRLSRRLPRQQQPDAVRLAYFQALRNLIFHARQMVRTRLVPLLPELVRQAGSERGDAEREDAVGKRVSLLLERISEDFYRDATNSRLERLAQEYAERTSRHQREQLERQIRAAVGIEIPMMENGIAKRIEAFTEENVALIKSIPQRYFDDVEKRVISNMRAGTRWEGIAQELEDRYGVAESSAKLVARDQVGKFFGELNKVRQEGLGIDTYIWRTSNDNRVRPEHEERDGKSFSWEDPPEDGAPGEAINCRCFAEPDLSSILEEL